MPGVAAGRPGHGHKGLAGAAVARHRVFDGPAGLGIKARGPVDGHEGLGRDELAGHAIEHIEHAVLGGLHDDLAIFVGDFDVGQDHVIGGVVIPVIARCGLVVPDVLAGLGLERDDGAEEQIVAAAGAAQSLVPRRAVAGADIQQVGV